MRSYRVLSNGMAVDIQADRFDHYTFNNQRAALEFYRYEGEGVTDINADRPAKRMERVVACFPEPAIVFEREAIPTLPNNTSRGSTIEQ